VKRPDDLLLALARRIFEGRDFRIQILRKIELLLLKGLQLATLGSGNRLLGLRQARLGPLELFLVICEDTDQMLRGIVARTVGGGRRGRFWRFGG
jgi:hypothetical protein